jgi:sigma-E factor negative regulatory protein RseC
VIEEVGVVVSLQGEMAEVEAQRRSACGGCAVNGACGTSLIARYLGRKPLRLRAHNAIGAGPGERVVLGVPEDALLEASFVAYMVPLLALIGGALIGAQAAVLLVPGYAQGLSILGGLGSLAVSLWWLGRFSRARALDERYRPRILRRAIDPGRVVPLSGVGVSPEHHIDGA